MFRAWIYDARRRWARGHQVTPEMSEAFNFVTVLYAVVIGIGLTELLSGIGRLVRIPEQPIGFYVEHLAWALVLFFLYVMLWFATWEHRTRIMSHNFLAFCGSLSGPTLTYLATDMLLPSEMGQRTFDVNAHNQHDFFWFFVILASAHASFILIGVCVGGDSFVGQRTAIRALCVATIGSLAFVDNAYWHVTVLVLLYLLIGMIGLVMFVGGASVGGKRAAVEVRVFSGSESVDP